MPFVESVLRDVRQSMRSLARERGFTFTVLLILALCLAANVAIFSVVNRVLLTPLPFHDPQQLVLVANAYPKAGVERSGVSVPHYLERKKEIEAFADAAALRNWGVTIGDAGAPERVDAASVTPSFFRVLGVSPALGRAFTDEEGFYGKHQVVLLSDGLWRQRFGGDPAVIGKTLRVNTESFTIIGVMPAGFRYLSQTSKLWTPLCFSDEDRKPDRRHSNNMDMIARLKPGVTIAEAQAQIDALNARTLKEDGFAKIAIDAGFHTTVFDLGRDYVSQLRPVLLLLQAGVLFLLLIGLVNLANLLLVRATGRAKEFCVRQALGASGGQLARTLVVESVLLSVVGGVVGLGLGAVALKGIAQLAADRLPVRFDANIDLTVAAVAVAASLVLGLVLALPVVWHTLRGSMATALSVESRGGTTTRNVHRLRHGLIVAQIALAFVLLAGTGLLGLSFARVMAVKPGFQAEQVLTGFVALPWSKYKDDKDRVAFVERLATELKSSPGVTAVGVSSGGPFSNSNDDNAIWVEGYAVKEGESLQAHFTSGVGGDYFNAMGIPLREGRFLTMEDSRAEARVCVIDESVAKRYWPKGSALGHRLANEPPGAEQKPYTIVGVVGAVKQSDLAEKMPRGAVYFPYKFYASLGLGLVVRTARAPESASSMLRATVLRLDPELPVHDVQTMEARIEGSVAGRRVPLLLAGIFAVVALVLAAVGIYGVLAYAVAQRQREIGVRMALGAQPEQILGQFLMLGGKLLLIGLPLGLLGAWLAGRAMTSLLFGVEPTNPVVLGGTALVLASVAMLACFLPSRRAARVSPIEALRAN